MKKTWNDFDDEWNRIDITDAGLMVTNLGHCAVMCWRLWDTTAVNINAGYIWCGEGRGWSVTPDVTNHDLTSLGTTVNGYGERSMNSNCLFTRGADWVYGFKESDFSGDAVYNIAPESIYSLYLGDVVGIDGIAETDNVLVFVSNSVTGRLAKVGPCYSDNDNLAVVDYIYGLGFDDGEFTGGLDVSIDSDGDIITLEDHGAGVFRFQKFDSRLNWIYSCMWDGTGNPIRIDFDVSDNQLYLLVEEGIHILSVE